MSWCMRVARCCWRPDFPKSLSNGPSYPGDASVDSRYVSRPSLISARCCPSPGATDLIESGSSEITRSAATAAPPPLAGSPIQDIMVAMTLPLRHALFSGNSNKDLIGRFQSQKRLSPRSVPSLDRRLPDLPVKWSVMPPQSAKFWFRRCPHVYACL